MHVRPVAVTRFADINVAPRIYRDAVRSDELPRFVPRVRIADPNKNFTILGCHLQRKRRRGSDDQDSSLPLVRARRCT